MAKDANNNNVYAGADGNVYKKDSDGNWSKWDNGSWTPVTPPSNVTQAKSGAQTKAGQNNQNLGSGSQGAGSTDSNRRTQHNGTPAPPSPSGPNSPSSGSLGSSDTMNQLQNDADGRSRGDQLEQSRNGGRGAGRGAGSGGGGGRRRP